MNQNFDAGWRLITGEGEVLSSEGLLALQLPAGPQHLVLKYRSAGFAAGLVLASAALGLMVVVWRRGSAFPANPRRWLAPPGPGYFERHSSASHVGPQPG